MEKELTNELKKILKEDHDYIDEARIENIPIKKIAIDPNNPREFFLTLDDLYHDIPHSDPNYSHKIQEKQSLETLAISIKEQGIINPIIVYKSNDNYYLIAGERRTLGSIIAGKSEIQAKVLNKKPSDLKVSILQWVENIERRDLNLWERLKNIEKIVFSYAQSKNKKKDQVTITELSHLIHCTKSHAMNYKAVLFSDTELQNLIKENKIKNLEKAAIIANIKSSEVKKTAISFCLKGASLKKLKAMIKSGSTTENKLRKARGRQSHLVNFGVTKNIDVAKEIINSILRNSSLPLISEDFNHIDWTNYKVITDTFKRIIKKLEEIHLKH